VTIEQHIVSLEALAAADKEIAQLSEQLEQERGTLDGRRSEAAGLEERLAADRQAVAEMDKTRQEVITELRQIDKQVDRSRERLSRARNEREQQAAERELDELRKLQRDRDDEIKKILTLTDEARTSIDENEARLSTLSGELEESSEGASLSIVSLEKQIAEKQAARDQVADKLPSLTRRRYQSMHDRGKLPVAKTTDGTCLGCFVKLPPMLFHTMLSRTKFEECPNCHRIIYYTPPAPEGGEDDDAAADDAAADAAEASGGAAAGAGASEADPSAGG
jgi:predicted  nucleic acid-binding Zn-ribbon protein